MNENNGTKSPSECEHQSWIFNRKCKLTSWYQMMSNSLSIDVAIMAPSIDSSPPLWLIAFQSSGVEIERFLNELFVEKLKKHISARKHTRRIVAVCFWFSMSLIAGENPARSDPIAASQESRLERGDERHGQPRWPWQGNEACSERAFRLFWLKFITLF